MNELEITSSALDSSKHKISATKTIWLFLVIALVIVSVSTLTFVQIANQPSKTFPTDSHFTVDQGMSLDAIVQKAKDEGYVRSHFLLFTILSQLHDPSKIYAGNYQLESPITTFEFATLLASQAISVDSVSLTIPEGVRASSIATIANAVLDDFDNDRFIQNAEEREGYLFPDTYFIPASFTGDELITLLQETFREKTTHLQNAIASSSFSEYEILIIASILEREANSVESMKMVAGILRNRLDINMPLQVDASIEYILDKPLSELTPDDLTIVSPYNTYTTNNLPPTPIGNPGLSAIESVLYPTESEYLFYITDEEGTFHYARTFDEHRRNISLYLR